MVLNQLNLVSNNRHTAYLFDQSGYEECSGKNTIAAKITTHFKKPSISVLKAKSLNVDSIDAYFWLFVTISTIVSTIINSFFYLAPYILKQIFAIK